MYLNAHDRDILKNDSTLISSSTDLSVVSEISSAVAMRNKDSISTQKVLNLNYQQVPVES